MTIVRRLRRLLPEPIVRRAKRLMPQGELTRGVLTLVLGTTIGQGIVILSSPILTRLYSPSDLGTFSVLTSILAILLTITVMSYDWAIPLPENDQAAANVLVLCLVINLTITVAAGIVLLVAGPTLLAIFGVPILVGYVLLLAADQLVGGVGLAFTGWAIRTRTFSVLAASRVIQSGTVVTVQVFLGVVGLGALGLLVADIAGRLAASASLARAALRTHASSFRHVTRGGLRFAATRYRRFPILSTGSALLNTLGTQAPLLVLVALYGTQVGGEYALAQRVAALPVILVAGSVGQVYFAEAARLAREQPAGLRALFLRTTGSLARGGFGPSALVAITAPLLFAPVFGEDWRQAGLFAALLAPMYYLTLVSSPTGGTLDVLERQDLHLARELFRLCIVGGAVLVAAAMHLSPVEAVAVLSAAGCLTYVLYGLISWLAIVRHRARPRPASSMTE